MIILFANRVKALTHDMLEIWLAARRLRQGEIFSPDSRHSSEVELGIKQLQSLVLGLGSRDFCARALQRSMVKSNVFGR
ncbi:IS66 family insertion sequence element accessory protein TnpB [Pseudomonas sp. R11-23-07]|uniref:IS66 family insertion sequence element accessory protein TnpB n=1 Tax=Pseudomonas sp. R11-23-07 TaxID=658632 RepID=UPI0013DDC68C|nr:IS66 family insertion sequence element accessory protein TnpB [Pseudomonas sp. R11-23-07]